MPGPYYAAGTYHVNILDAALAESARKEDGSGGNPQIVLNIKVMETGDSQPVGAQYDRRIYLTVTDKSKEMVLKKLRWAGWEGERFETFIADLTGRTVTGICAHDVNKGGKYDGQLSEKWDLELPPRESKPLENKPTVAKKLNALFGKMLKDKPSPEQADATVATTADGDDIPF